MAMSAKGKRALVVDDVPVNRKLAMAFFTKLGWHVAGVEGGNTALDWLANNPAVDIVLLDISMPDMSGEEVCRQLRANPNLAALPIVAYTAHAMQGDVERFLSNGFDSVLIKPISMQRLKEIIATFCPE